MSEQRIYEPVDGRYECDNCGVCCRAYVVEVTEKDLEREPRLKKATIPLPMIRAKSSPACREYALFLREGDREVKVRMYMENHHVALLAFGTQCPTGELFDSVPCAFLNERNQCDIHATKPKDCYEYEAGGSRCQEMRRRAGLPPLQPVDAMHQVVLTESHY